MAHCSALRLQVQITFLQILFVLILSTGIVSADEVKNILIISIDALHPKALNSKTSSNLQKLMEQGVYTLDGFSTKPPLTLVSHAAMFSGIGPEKGGRQNNSWDSGQSGIDGETIFNTTGKPIFSAASAAAFALVASCVSRVWKP